MYKMKKIFLAIFIFVVFISACGSGGGGGGGTTDTTGSAPSAPTGVLATAGSGQVSISWSSVSGATSYNIYWSTSSGVTKTTGTKISSATSPYTHTGRTNGTVYYYVVTAVNDNGEGGESAEVPVTPWAPIPLPKTGQTTCYD